MRDYKPLLDLFRSRDQFLLTTHVIPDGDGLGSALGLAGGLRKMGKDVRILVPSPVPAPYRFLDPEGRIEHLDADSPPQGLSDCQVVVVLDCGEWKRLAKLGPVLEPLAATKVCIDHHQGNSGFADVALLDTEAAATAELIYEMLIEEEGVELDFEMAQALYVSLVTETGGFQYSNTSAKLHRMTAHLIEQGVDPNQVHIELDQRKPARQIRFLARALQTLEVDDENGLAWVAVGPEIFQETGAETDDIVGLVSYPRSLDGVELAIMFFEDVPGSVKISFRSKRWFDVSQFARQFDGGGHVRASGALIESPLAEAVDRVTRAARKDLAAARPGNRE